MEKKETESQRGLTGNAGRRFATFFATISAKWPRHRHDDDDEVTGNYYNSWQSGATRSPLVLDGERRELGSTIQPAIRSGHPHV